jgi:hypothetical protein
MKSRIIDVPEGGKGCGEGRADMKEGNEGRMAKGMELWHGGRDMPEGGTKVGKNDGRDAKEGKVCKEG